MKIGFDAKRLFNNRTGLGNYSRTLHVNLQKYYPDNEYFLYSPEIRLNEYKKELEGLGNVNIRTAGNKNSTLWRSFDIKKDINSDELDVYHGLSHELPRKNDKLNCKKVVTIHDLIFKLYPKYFPRIDRTFYNIKCRHSLSTADKIVAISQSTKNDIIEHYNIPEEKIEVIYQTCAPIYYEDNPTSSSDHITAALNFPAEYNLCVGSIEPRKNIETIIKAYSLLDRSHQIPLIIIGQGNHHKNAIQKKINDAYLHNMIFIKSNIQNIHLPTIYKKAKMLIYPSHYEGFGLPVVESLLCGTPVITSDNSSLREAGGPNSIYIDSKNPESIASAITQVLDSDMLAKQMADSGKSYALKTFSPDKISTQLMSLYNSII